MRRAFSSPPGFPDPGEITNRWQLDRLTVKFPNTRHGAQLILEMGATEAWILKRARVPPEQVQKLNTIFESLNQIPRRGLALVLGRQQVLRGPLMGAD